MPRHLVVVAVAAGLCAVGCRGGRPQPVPGAPVILVSIDTLRADRLPSYGYRSIATPQIDALAAESAVFERCLAHSPQTLPSHATLFAGVLPPATGVRDNAGFRLADDLPTLASTLRAAGYRTAGFVSAIVLREETGIARGFELWDDDIAPPSPRAGLGAVQRAGPETVARALAWLETMAAGRPYLLFVHLYEPHTPYAPPPHLAGRGASPYDAEVVAADEALAPLFSALRLRGDWSRAVIALVSDHGEGLGEHGEDEHGLFLYEEAVRVPFILKPPGASLGGSRVTGLAALSDLAPTLLELVAAPPLEGATGLSLVTALGSGRIAPRTVYGEALYGRYHFGWAELYSATEARLRFIRAPRAELFDLERDPEERDNLAGGEPVARERLAAFLDERLAGAAPGAPAATSLEEQEKLAALGYLGSIPALEPGAALPDPKDRVGSIRRYREALAARRQGDLERTVTQLRDLLADEPRMTDAWDSLVRAEMDRDRYAEALAAVGELRRLLPDGAAPHLLAARILLKLERPEDAHAAASLAVAREPGRANELLCRVRLEQGRLAEALGHARLALASDPDLPLPYYARGVAAAAEGRYEAALAEFQLAAAKLELHPRVELRSLHLMTGDVLARLGRNREAERELAQELSIAPPALEARLRLAALWKSEGRDGEAARVLVEVGDIAPDSLAIAEAVRGLALLGEPRAARALLARGRERFPGDRRLAALPEAGR